MSPIARRLVRAAALFAALLLPGAWPWAGAAHAFSALYCPVANLIVSHQTFGRGGHARLAPVDRIERRATDNITADAAVALTVDGFAGDMRLGVSLRRDAYLPLLIAIALLAAAPIAIRRRLHGMLVALPVIVLWTVAVFDLLIVWTFATQLRGIYSPSALDLRLVDLAYGALLAPPGNRFIAPIALGIGITLWQAQHDRKRHVPVTKQQAAEGL